MNKHLLIDAFGWGIALWFVGYILGIILFFFLPQNLIGWVIMPVGIVLSLLVLWKKVKQGSFVSYLQIAAVWTLLAVLFDFVFLVQLFHPKDGYYKPDVFLYYLLTFLLPIFVGWFKTKNK